MVNVDVDVKDAPVVFCELQDGKHNVVHVTEPRGLAPLGVVKAARPVDHDVVLLLVQLDGAADRPARVALAELVQAIEHGAILADVVPLQLAQMLVLVVGRDEAQELDVLVRVEARELVVRRGRGPVHLHLLIQAVVQEQVVRHADAVRLHRVPLPVVVVPDLCVVEVGDLETIGAAKWKGDRATKEGRVR